MKRGQQHSLSSLKLPAIVALLLLVAVALFVPHAVKAAHSHTTTSHAESLFSTGELTLSESNGALLVVDAGGVVPGGSVSGSLTINLDGDSSADVVLANAGVTDTPACASLSQALDLCVEDVTSTTETIYAGTISGLTNLSLGEFEPGTTRSYRFTVTFPAENAVDALRNATTSLTLEFAGVAR